MPDGGKPAPESDHDARRAAMALCAEAQTEELRQALASIGYAGPVGICAGPRPGW